MLIKFKKAVLLWFDSSQSNGVTSDKVDWFRIVPFVFFSSCVSRSHLGGN